jgi:dipeptidase E
MGGDLREEQESLRWTGLESSGVLELSVLPGIDEQCRVPPVQETGALLVWGGDPVFLSYWMRRSGLADVLPSLPSETVYLGVTDGNVEVVSEGHWKLFTR